MEKEQIKQNLKSTHTWVRILFIILFVIFYGVSEAVFSVMVFFQIIHGLVAARPNERIVRAGTSLSKYMYQLLLYMVMKSDEKPFPFNEWPSIEE